MEYRTEFDVWEFPWWSGARDTIEDIKKADKMDELQSHLEDVFSCDETPPTDTDINDYVWHDRAHVYEALELDENGHPKSAFDTGDFCTYDGVECEVLDCRWTDDGWEYDLRESDGDGEYNDIGEEEIDK